VGIKLNVYQLQRLADFFEEIEPEPGDQLIELEWLPAGIFLNGEPREAGLYFWDPEYPDEGCELLPESE
jgi:hypothetical protein